MSTVEVTDHPELTRWVATVDGEPAGFAQYIRRGGRVLFVHTVVDDAFEGRGVGSALARAALDGARVAGDPVVPLCPFIAAYIEKHPEHADLVDTEALARFDR
jgi:predicted GNAT family acetyltransferase